MKKKAIWLVLGFSTLGFLGGLTFSWTTSRTPNSSESLQQRSPTSTAQPEGSGPAPKLESSPQRQPPSGQHSIVGPGLDSRALQELQTRNASLQEQIQRLRSELDASRSARETEPEPVTQPAQIPERFSQKHLLAAFTAGLREAGIEGDVTAMDCSEYPCMVIGEGVGSHDDVEKLRGTSSFKDYRSDSTSANTWTSNGRKLFVLTLYNDEQRSKDILARLAYRISQIREAMASTQIRR